MNNNLPFLQRVGTSLGNYFSPEQGQNVPPEVQSFVPQSQTPPAIGRTIRGLLANQPQPDFQAQQQQVPQPQPSMEQFMPQQEMSPLDQLVLLLQLLMQEGGGINAKSEDQIR
mgnify:CR=1 FL=1